jgi:hypothetical protein
VAKDKEFRTDEEKAAEVDRIFEEAGFEFADEEEDNGKVTYYVAPLLHGVKRPPEADEAK